MLVEFLIKLLEEDSSSKMGERWTLFVNGESNMKGSGIEIILENDLGVWIQLSLKFEFLMSNNQTEYETLITSLLLTKDMGV